MKKVTKLMLLVGVFTSLISFSAATTRTSLGAKVTENISEHLIKPLNKEFAASFPRGHKFVSRSWNFFTHPKYDPVHTFIWGVKSRHTQQLFQNYYSQYQGARQKLHDYFQPTISDAHIKHHKQEIEPWIESLNDDEKQKYGENIDDYNQAYRNYHRAINPIDPKSSAEQESAHHQLLEKTKQLHDIMQTSAERKHPERASLNFSDIR